MPPAAMTLITSGVFITIVFNVLLVMNAATIHAVTVADADSATAQTDFRHYAIWALMAKIYIGEFLKNNIIWAGAAEEYTDK